MSPRLFAFGAAAFVLAGTTCPALRAEEVTLERAFARTATLRGETYRACRDVLVRQGKEIVPFLKEKAKSADWQERDLARALLLRLERPELAPVADRLTNGWGHRLAPAANGGLKVEWDPEETASARRSGNPIPPADAPVLGPDTAPLLIELLREQVDEASRTSGRAHGWTRTLDALHHFAPAEAAPALVHWHGIAYGLDETMLDILVKIGEPSLPPLRDAARKGGYFAGPAAARTLARLGDRKEGAAVLVERLRGPEPGYLTEPYAAALAAMKVPAALPVILDHLEQAAARTRAGKTGSSHEATYGGLRQSVVAYGEAARDILRKRAAERKAPLARAMATGLVWEVEHPREAAELYRKLGQEAAHDRGADAKTDPLAAGRQRVWVAHSYGGWHDAGLPDGDRLPTPLLLERAAARAGAQDLAALGGRKGEPLVYEVIADALNEVWFGHYSPQAMFALAACGDERAVEVFRQLIDRQPHAVCVSAVPEALLRLGSPKGADLLEELLRRAEKEDPKAEVYRPTAETARAILPALKGKPDLAVTLLTHSSPTVRQAAGRFLALRGDTRALPVLVREAAAEPAAPEGGFRPARRRAAELDTSGHLAQREAVVGMGKAALPVLEKVRKESESWRVRLVCEACALRIARPELGAAYDREAAEGNHIALMPMIPRYAAGGGHVAAAVGKDAVPLVEASLTFGTELVAPCAAYALGHLKDERSLPVVINAIPYLHGARSEELVGAAVLGMFGEKGVAAAKKIPPPDPNKENYDDRAMRHGRATVALSEAEEVKGVENILEALKAKVPAKGTPEFAAWAGRMRLYLGAAVRYDDARLLEPLLRIVAHEDHEIGLLALNALAPYRDRRIVERAVSLLGKAHPDRQDYADPAVTALLRQLGEDVGPFLVREFREAKGEPSKRRAARALTNVFQHAREHWAPRRVRVMTDKSPSVKQQDGPPGVGGREKGPAYKEVKLDVDQERTLAAARRAAAAPLLEYLRDPSPAVQTAAAEVMSAAAGADDYPRVAGPLAKWLVGQTEPPQAVIGLLIRTQDPAAPPALLAVYQRKWQGQHWRLHGEVLQYLVRMKTPGVEKELLRLYRASNLMDSGIASALADLKCEEAIDDIVRGAHARAASGASAELDALLRLGPAGQARVHAIAQSAVALSLRLEAARRAAWSLRTKGFFDLNAKLFEELLTNGLKDRRLTREGDQRGYEYRNHMQTLVSLLSGLDAKRGHAVLSLAMFRADDATLADMAGTVRRMEIDNPALRKERMPLQR